MKTVIEMAREAGLWAFRGPGLRPHVPEDVFAGPVKITKEIEVFAELVRADEREACANLVLEMKGQCWAYDHDTIAAAIRNRSTT